MIPAIGEAVDNRVKARPDDRRRIKGVEMPAMRDEPTALQRFGRDLTALAQARVVAPVEGYEPWVSRVLTILRRPPNSRYNPVLIGLVEAEGRPIVAEVVRRIACGEIPAALSVRQVVALDWDAVVRNLPAAGEPDPWAASRHQWFTREELAADMARWERLLESLENSAPGVSPRDDRAESLPSALSDVPDDPIYDPIHQRLEAVFVDVRRSRGQVLLYVEQLQRLFGGEQEPYPVYMQDLLKPALARGELRILGTCSVEAYREYIEKDAAMQRRFNEVCSPDLLKHLGRDEV